MNNSLKQAIAGLRANPGRTFLTTLGIVIGVATVILVLSAGAGFRGFINAQIAAYGTNAIYVQTKVPPTTKARQSGSTANNGPSSIQAVIITTLKNRDVADIKKISNIIGAYGAVMTQKVVSFRNVSKNVFVFGSDASRFAIDQGVIENGRPYTDAENIGAEQVALLGADVAVDLFGDQDPVGQIIRIGEYNFSIIGVYERRGAAGFSNDDQQIFVPLVTAQKKLMGVDYINFILAQFENPKLSEATAEDIRFLMRSNHTISNPDKDDFDVSTSQSNLATFDTILQGVTLLLIAIAAISLLVGGVGIMNIMYVVVTERISEIGLKKALGAKDADILSEFLIEAVILTLTGGILGIILGALLALGIAQIAQFFHFDWVYSVPLSGIILGLGVSSGIGLIFGVFPARRASKLNPIEALHYE